MTDRVSMSWTCDTCHASGHVETAPVGEAVVAAIGSAHKAASPECGSFPTTVTVLDGEVMSNGTDSPVIIAKPTNASASRVRLLPAVVAMTALAGAAPPFRAGGRRASPRMREQRNHDYLARKDRLVAKAEAKRARKRSAVSLNDQDGRE